MSDALLFLSHRDTLQLLTASDALEIVEEVYRMHARGSVVWSTPPSFKMDVPDFHNHWHVKGCFLKDVPVAGVRMYGYYDDGERTTVGTLDSTRFVVISDPATSVPLAIVDEHWSFALRSTAAAVVACKWLARPDSKVLGLVGVGSMGVTALQCLITRYRFEEIRCTSRRPETRERFADEWSKTLGVPVIPKDTPEEVARGADIVVGGTTSSDIICREPWLIPGSTFVNLARRELDPAGWRKMDKVVLDDFDLNMLNAHFRELVADGHFSRAAMHAEIWEIVAGRKPGRERSDERVLISTTGLVSQDVAIAHWMYRKALDRGLGSRLPLAHRP